MHHLHYIYIYAFSRQFYPKRLTGYIIIIYIILYYIILYYSGYTFFFVSVPCIWLCHNIKKTQKKLSKHLKKYIL